MKHLATSILFLVLWEGVVGQAGMWTWMKGSSSPNSFGSRGVKGVPSITNEPSARYASGYWTDTTGTFWVYGGVILGWNLWGDLWKFDSNTSMWTWMHGDSTFGIAPVVAASKGVFHSSNSPGSLGFGMFTWVTPDNHLWLYGGAASTGTSSNLWQYNPATNQWAWMGNFGPSFYGTKGTGTVLTMPGERVEGNVGWVDSAGDLWLFGGENKDLDNFNDVWKYDVSSGIWTWMSGTSLPNDSGTYGSQGLPSINNCPPSRNTNLFWKDNSGNLWLSGGSDYTNDTQYQDVWKFNSQNGEWTWISGSRGVDQTSAGGVVCDADTANKMGARYENRTVWKICDQLILTCAGMNVIGPLNTVYNDLWAYNLIDKLWIHVTHNSSLSNYGIKGVPHSLNSPPVRCGQVGFKDEDSKVWMFGGLALGSISYFNDLWKYVIDTTCLPTCSTTCSLIVTISANETIFCSGDSAQVCAPSGYANYLWNTGETTACIKAQLAGNYYVTVTDNNGCTAESNHLAITVLPLPPVAISVNGDTLSVYGAVTQQWFLNGSAINNATSNIYIATQGGSYTVAVTDSNGCLATSSAVIISGIDNLTEEDVVSVYPNPLDFGFWILECGSNWVGSTAEVTDADGRVVFESKITLPKSKIEFNATRGVYLLRISSAKSSVVKKLIRL